MSIDSRHHLLHHVHGQRQEVRRANAPKLGRRIYKHKSAGKQGRPGIDAAINLYGWENFTVEIIETCPVEFLNEREMFWIRELNTKAPNGYNLTDGGESCLGFKHTDESRAKISANHADVSGEKNPQYGKHPSDETRARISANHADVSGEKNPNYGKPLSDEQKAKMSASRKGKKFGSRSPETCAKISAALKGKPSPSKGIKRSAEARARMSAAQKARWAKKKLESQNNS